MAFLKSDYSTDAGVSVEYWAVMGYQVNVVDRMVDITFGGWVSKDVKDAQKRPVQIRTVRVLKEDFQQYFSTSVLSAADVNPISQAYRYVKENGLSDDGAFFKDSTDAV